MHISRQLPDMRAQLRDWRRQGQRIALVPTMGNLHAGHLALVEAAHRLADRVVVSIFVNPSQFVAGEDFSDYPRSETADCEQLARAAVDGLFMPEQETMYPTGCDGDTRVTVPALDDILCGEYRPGHFAGVATVVTKLFNMLRPDIAVFGEKDYQQLLVIRRLVIDLALEVDIHSVATLREDDGLALSSRNAYLSATERALAPLLYEVLSHIAGRLAAGAGDYRQLETAALRELADAGWQPQYIAVRDAGSLGPPQPDSSALVVLGAAWLGRARLIDNIRVSQGG